ncbi:MAG: UPF0175 family protein [Gammaproteobacteria bacterium]|nr:UPF0175 family protein [Gammaproteobacteria bacterium]
MPEHVINISLPVKENILLSLKETEQEFKSDILYMSALSYYKKGKLSIGKAAELAGYSRLDFIDKLRLDGEVIFDYSEQDLESIYDDVDKIR